MLSKMSMYRPSLIKSCTYRLGCLLWFDPIKPAHWTSPTHQLQFNRTLSDVEVKKSAFGGPTFNTKAASHAINRVSKQICEGQSFDVNVLKSAFQRESLLNEEVFPYWTLQLALKTKQNLETVEKVVQDLESRQFAFDIPELAILIEIYRRQRAEDLVLSTYERMCEISDGVFDLGTLTVIIRALCTTSKWRKCFKLLDLCLIIKPSVNTNFDVILAAAAAEGDFHTVCTILVKMDNLIKSQGMHYTEQHWPFHVHAFVSAYLSALDRGVEHFTFDNLFFLVRKYKLSIDEEDIPVLITQLNRSGYLANTEDQFVSGDQFVPVLKNFIHQRWNQQPTCEICKSTLNKQELTNEEFEELQEAYFALSGVNVYLKSSPMEMKLLENLIHRKGQFDVVIDHLNTCYDNGDLTYERSVSIVKQVVNSGLTCLVVTRNAFFRHFPPSLKDELQQYATIFISASSSLDDLIVLDATFHSGFNTMLLSNDKFSDHSCLLGPRKHHAFFRWQKCRQILHYTSYRKQLYFPESPDEQVQESEGGWHIPFGVQDKKVLCVRKKEENLKIEV